MVTPLRPIIGNGTITYNFGNGKETIKYRGPYFKDDILTRTATELTNAKMDNKGNIDASTVNTIFLNLCEHIRGKDEITKLKPLFDACTDEASDGGNAFTPKEQQKIMSILKAWCYHDWK